MRRPSLLTSPGQWSNESRGSIRGRCRRPLNASLLAAAAALTLTACGGVTEAPEEPAAKPVELNVSEAKFSSERQHTGDSVTLSIVVENTGDHPAPNLNVTLSGLEESEATVEGLEGEQLSSESRPSRNTRAPWFVDSGPGGTALAGGSTFNSGPLAAGEKRTLRWNLAARVAGQHELGYQVAAGLTDNEARATRGEGLTGSVSATITES